jgi:hypothetical protein
LAEGELDGVTLGELWETLFDTPCPERALGALATLHGVGVVVIFDPRVAGLMDVTYAAEDAVRAAGNTLSYSFRPSDN